jgi:alkylation response protein AidB-like acyl-CoA dehydrogenase
MPERRMPNGGEFIFQETAPEQAFSPEMLTSESHLIARTMEEFMRREVTPLIPRLEAQEPGLLPALLRKAGELGLLAGGVPERYGGLGLPKTTLTLLAEKAATYLSFAISLGVHTGVATLPLLFFGTEEQKLRYLPQLASGRMIGAFALSEANSGSDALAARTTAALSPDGAAYRLAGEKMWITNGGFADLFTLFARADGDRFTAFLVEKGVGGLTAGREEQKMGLHGSSTCRLALSDVPVPVGNVLGEVGKGHRPALYALNIGRFNIGAAALGAAKECLRLAVRYARERRQFGRPIGEFDLIRHKLAEMAIRVYALESMVYRVAGCWDALVSSMPADDATEALLRASEEYAIECAIIKFYGTEALGNAADEAVQIHGGYGYSEEFPVARMYRDARVFRIFEGTNEINRLTALDQLLRRIASGRLSLPARRSAPASSQQAIAEFGSASDTVDSLPEIGAMVTAIRELTTDILRVGIEQEGDRLGKNQMFAAAIADMAALLFALESAWLRISQPRGARQTDDIGLPIVQALAAETGSVAERLAQAALASLPAESAEANFYRPDFIPNSRTAGHAFVLRQQIAAQIANADILTAPAR